MVSNATQEILDAIDEASRLYYRLILFVAPIGSGKTAILQEIQKMQKIPLMNVNLELSKRMLDIAEKKRASRVQKIMNEMVADCPDDLILLDNIEMLFDVALQVDPLRLLQILSRNKTLVSSWSGTVIDHAMIYASSDHAEYRRYPIRDFLCIRL